MAPPTFAKMKMYGCYDQNDDQTYQWYRNGEALEGETGRSLRILTSGTYQLAAYNCNMESAWSDEFDFTVHPVTTPELKDDSWNSSLCDGDTLWLEEPEGEVQIKWSYYNTAFPEFDDLPYFIVKDDYDANPNRVTFINEHECEHRINVPYFYVYDRPDLFIEEDTLIQCEGSNQYLNLTTDGTVYWNDGVMGGYREFTESGTYYAHAENYNGCISPVDSVTVIIHDRPFFTLMGDTAINLGESLIIPGPEGFEEYSWSGGFTEQDFHFTPAIDGVYYIQLRAYDRNGCFHQDYVTVIVEAIPLSAEINKRSSLEVYPNPTEGILFTNTTIRETVKVVDIAGREVLKTYIEGQQVDLSQLDKGIYFVVIGETQPAIKIRKR